MPCLALLPHGEGCYQKAMLGTEKRGLDAELLNFGHLLLAGGDELVIYHHGKRCFRFKQGSYSLSACLPLSPMVLRQVPVSMTPASLSPLLDQSHCGFLFAFRLMFDLALLTFGSIVLSYEEDGCL
jgi:hypothetical protein